MSKEKEVRSSLACAIGTVTGRGSPEEAISHGGGTISQVKQPVSYLLGNAEAVKGVI